VAGSLSARTRDQVGAFTGPAVTVDARRAHEDPDGVVGEVLGRLAAAYRHDSEQAALVHSGTDHADLERVQAELGTRTAAAAVERVLGEVARRSVAELGVRRLLVAGGETSGAVTAALGVHVLHVGREVGPGVPWTVSGTDPAVALLLKSGNFGPVDLFTSAWRRSP
jgi:uncharacterized protein YgbK (DUF1537 family)